MSDKIAAEAIRAMPSRFHEDYASILARHSSEIGGLAEQLEADMLGLSGGDASLYGFACEVAEFCAVLRLAAKHIGRQGENLLTIYPSSKRP